jgi:hypothetical protein
MTAAAIWCAFITLVYGAFSRQYTLAYRAKVRRVSASYGTRSRTALSPARLSRNACIAVRRALRSAAAVLLSIIAADDSLATAQNGPYRCRALEHSCALLERCLRNAFLPGTERC